MLKMTIEIHPFGRSEDKRSIKEIFIANDTTGDAYKGNYKIWVDNDPRDRDLAPPFKRPKPDIELKKFKRNLGAQELVRQILNKLYAKETKKAKQNQVLLSKRRAKSS